MADGTGATTRANASVVIAVERSTAARRGGLEGLDDDVGVVRPEGKMERLSLPPTLCTA